MTMSVPLQAVWKTYSGELIIGLALGSPQLAQRHRVTELTVRQEAFMQDFERDAACPASPGSASHLV